MSGTGADAAAAVRVVSVTFNPGDELEAFARSLADATSRPVTLVLVDNGSDPSVVDDVAARYGATVLRPGRNLGYGAAANLGAREGEEPWVVVANPDLVWHAGALDELLAAGARHPRAGSLGPRILNLDGTLYPSARAIPSLTQGAGHAVFARFWPGNPWSRAYRRQQEVVEASEHAVGWLSGACLLLRREALAPLGGFDERYFMFFEDVDLGDRLGRAGWQNLYVPTAAVVHDQGASWRERPTAMIRAHHRSAEQYLHGRYAAWWQAPLRWAITLGLRTRAWWETRGR
ncbi:glycosyltransferase family 2 protein [Georgenia yuyongxinii]|uniref:Glycosyltransferase family 2 protein n=1 Tax=Georgenia yuyongxinii TaxID=2589797 RepID=A0A552WXU5_9MICO|nr:glycosyltransferase family 2 protein [Georgenia yuyongxinii]TRW47661.1 glycosyltransferase family 2 protein [Georgenia yuyongxinii]